MFGCFVWLVVCLFVCLFVPCIGTQSIASLAAPCPEVRGGGQMELVLYLSQSPLPPLPVLCLSGVFSGLVVFRSCCVVRPCAPCHAQARRALHKTSLFPAAADWQAQPIRLYPDSAPCHRECEMKFVCLFVCSLCLCLASCLNVAVEATLLECSGNDRLPRLLQQCRTIIINES